MLNTTIVAVGIDDCTAQHLTTTGHTLENPGPSAEMLFGRMVAAPAKALILGNHTRIDGWFVERLRAHKIDTPVIRIADGPRGEKWSHECAHFLDCGGDDVIVGPAHPEEVAASVRNVCRRSEPADERIVRFRDPAGTGSSLEVNLTKSRAMFDGRLFESTAHETRMLFALASRAGTVSPAQLSIDLCGDEYQSNTVQVLICRLRKRLGSLAPLLVTRRGRGYELIGRVH